MNYYDETMKHIWEVERNMCLIASQIEIAAKSHDKSKLNEPEASGFEKLTQLLSKSTYGSDEYNSFLKELAPVLKHHYESNTHHPEHFENGISGMTLIDLVEMFCDWLAASKRHENGDIFKSISISAERFQFPSELKSIFENTAKKFFNKK
jgi:hypothetical protein